MGQYIQTQYLPSGSAMIATSSETQAWRVDLSGGTTLYNLILPTGAYIASIGTNGDAKLIATDETGADVSKNIVAGYFLPAKTTFGATSPATGGAIAMSYVNPSFTQA